MRLNNNLYTNVTYKVEIVAICSSKCHGRSEYAVMGQKGTSDGHLYVLYANIELKNRYSL